MVSTVSIIALIASSVILTNAATDYCRLKTCKDRNHTVCKYGSLKIDRRRCGTVKTSTLTRADIQTILDAHNKYRKFVASGKEKRGSNGAQPAAKNLGSLSWDKELAKIAQTWADQCNYSHDKCRDSERFRVGQNIAYMASTGGYNAKWTDMVKMWYDEVALFDKKQIKSVTKFNRVGHYTQMMWAKTKLLGCGGVRYNADGKWYKTYLVCNYGPTGNWQGGEMYKTR